MLPARTTYEILGQRTGGFRAIFESLPVGVIVADHSGTIVLFNPQAERMFGLTNSRLGTRQWLAACGVYLPDKSTPFPPEQFPLVRAMAGEEVADELMFVKNDGNRLGLWIRASARPLVDETGALHGAVAVHYDVTELCNAVERIRLLSRAVEQTADSVIITNKAGIIEYVNPAFEATTGFRGEQAIGHTPRILKSGHHAETFYRDLWDCILAGEPFRGTLVNRRKSGELYWAEQTITPIKNDAGAVTHFVSVLKDVTELKKKQEQEIQLKLAREVQQRFYASKVSVPGVEIGTAACLAEATGGDYCDLIPCTDGSICVAMGDVSGHDFGSALVMALTRAYIRSFCAQGLGAGKILTETNRMLVADLEENRFVTLLLAHVDVPGDVLSYASAGHVPGFVLDARGEFRYALESTGIPMGIFPEYHVATRWLSLAAGNIVVLLTDGATEGAGLEDHQLGTERIIKYVGGHSADSAQAIAEGICRTARAWAGDNSQKDDISAIVLKVGRSETKQPAQARG